MKVQREYIDTINHSAYNLLFAYQRCFGHFKIESGDLVLERKRFDVKNSFSQSVKLLKPLANKSNLLLYRVDPSVPAAIVGDQGRFAQI